VIDIGQAEPEIDTDTIYDIHVFSRTDLDATRTPFDMIASRYKNASWHTVHATR
jgi:hypothetical protein